jgi:hypothetical protein
MLPRSDPLGERAHVRGRPAEQVTLCGLQAELDRDGEVLVPLDTLSDHARAKVERNRLTRTHRCALAAVVGNPVDQRAVYLDEVGPELEDVAQRRVARADIVDGDA